MQPLRLMVYRHSVFYSPLLAGIGNGFFAAEDFQPVYSVMPADKTVGEFIASGAIDVSQSAVSASWPYLERSERPPFVHFAQINQRDGFLIAARGPVRDLPDRDLAEGNLAAKNIPGGEFDWSALRDAAFLFVHGGQPQAMLTYALHRQGVRLGAVRSIDAGDTQHMLDAFRAGRGDYIHEQAPYPQQLESEGAAHIVASVGHAIGPVAFSSLAASPAWLRSEAAPRFMPAYRKARGWAHSAPPAEVAASVQCFFPRIDDSALVAAVDYYQRLECWGADAGLDPALYEVALDVFAHSGLITRRHPYAAVVVPPPDCN
ncbi:MAG: hypothetical protein ABI612_12870 [Betaproteobacteria bacterium]